MAEIYNQTIDQGANWYFQVTYKDTAGAPINLTGYSAALELGTSYNMPTPTLAISTTTTGMTIPTPANGTIIVNVPAATTAALPTDNYVYVMTLTAPGGFITRLLEGKAIIAPDVSP